ncbi:MAG: ABC transporter transmembrane domain-containing protein [Sulfitobacter sp.]
MESSIFSFIWKYSKRQQIMLLGFTLLTFPLLYATLELPKRIINDAIGAQTDTIPLFGVTLTQTQFLLSLCFAYLAAVLIHGLLKMRLNTMKGVLSERLLRRFRYQLIARMMRFPRSYFQNTSQGELVSMVTSEAEPMGGLMGDAVAQPVFQAGQMAIIVIFLFAQSFWFGLAGVALIPLQAWLIPLLQRQINLLNKDRIKQVRHLASDIGETAAGISDLRTNGGWRYRLAGFTDRLGVLFDIRFKIYQKKFFMKFLNNFITQMTPFFFYSVGGVLAIRGDITVGALVAALAAYKDLSSPWKELLAYYNQTQDMSLRWQIVVERFAPPGMVDGALIEGEPDEVPHLRGPIELDHVSLRNADGNAVIDDVSLTIPQGASVAIKVTNQSERQALADLLTREVTPSRGKVVFAGHDLAGLHQSVIAARIGYASAKPYIFSGTIGENLMMPLRSSPKTVLWDPQQRDFARIEALRSGNSHDSLKADWLDPELAGLNTREEIHAWWFELVGVSGMDDPLFRAMLDARMDPQEHPELAARLVALRSTIYKRLQAEGLDKAVHRFDPHSFNPSVPLGGNLIFAAPRHKISQTGLAAERVFLSMIIEQGLAEQTIAISQTLVDMLHQTFGMDGTNHPLFTALEIEETLYEQLVDIAQRRREKGDAALTEDEFALLLTVPFAFTAEQVGPAFPESFKKEILRIRKTRGPMLREQAADMFIPIRPENYLPRLTLMENLLYGRISLMAGVKADLVKDMVAEEVTKAGLRQEVAVTVFDSPTAIGGTNISQIFQERAAFGRAGIKRPDILVLNQTIAHIGSDQQVDVQARLRELLPGTTQIYLDDHFENPDDFDMFIEISHGRLEGLARPEGGSEEFEGSDDLRRKLAIIQRNDLFCNLDARSQRLLAFTAQWYSAEKGQRIFTAGEPADAAYLCLSGKAELLFENTEGREQVVSTVEAGRLIGDLAILVNQPRNLDLVAAEETQFLRIGAEQFRSVVAADRQVLLSLLETVAGHLNNTADLIRSIGISLPQNGRGDLTQVLNDIRSKRE